MAASSKQCDLCGLPLRFGTFSAKVMGRTFYFCCNGCKQVFHMLSDAADGADPASFKETELFLKCREMGIIPRSETELENRFLDSVAPSHSDAESSRENRIDAPSGSTLNLNLKVSGMWCPACAWLIEERLSKTAGVLNASCNFSTDRVLCEYNPIRTSPNRIFDEIQRLGYQSVIPGEEIESLEKKREFFRFSVSAFLTMNVMMLSFSLYFGFFRELTADTIQKISWPIFFMASIVLFYGGKKIYQKAWTGIASAAFGMETLITAGAFSAYFYSLFNLFSGSIHLYFDTSSMLITLVLLGKLLERKAKTEVQESLENFFSLRPVKVRICTENNPDGRYVAAEQLHTGDAFRVEENEIIAADGRVLEGRGAVDESSLTGEALPVEKKNGDPVKSGTRITRGTFKIRAERVGGDSTLGQMIHIMEKALGKRTVLEGRTERILQWFVPLILVLAIGTGLTCRLLGFSLESAMIRAVTVMVISCPCALGIAIPLARVAGISVAGRKGILVRDFSAFERSEQVDTFVFDKTGTITQGEWMLLEIVPLESFDKEYALAIAASLENASDHFIAGVIKRHADKQNVKPVKVESRREFENGISGRCGSVEVKIGSKGFLSKEIRLSGYVPAGNGPEENPGRSMVYMSYDSRLCAVFIFGDRLRKGASDVVETLHTRGGRLSLISGDGDKTTKSLARQLGIEEAFGEQLPQDKVDYVAGLQKAMHKVAMVGDGINDAPALAQSDLAVAVYSGGHLGKESADITLMRSDPRQLIDFLLLAKHVNKKVDQNLVCAFLYNFISIPIAMSGLLNPLIAVCAMLLSSLSVIGNTLLLVKKS